MMKLNQLRVPVPAFVAAVAVALALSVAAQTPTPTAKSSKQSMAGSHQEAGMMAECKAMMAKKEEMQEKLQAMDVKLEKLVAEMNAAGTEQKVDAMVKPMAVVINELIAQRKAMRSMMMEMEPAMMTLTMHHMHPEGTKGAMKSMSDCPMMKMGGEQGHTPQPKGDAEEKPHKM